MPPSCAMAIAMRRLGDGVHRRADQRDVRLTRRGRRARRRRRGGGSSTSPAPATPSLEGEASRHVIREHTTYRRARRQAGGAAPPGACSHRPEVVRSTPPTLPFGEYDDRPANHRRQLPRKPYSFGEMGGHLHDVLSKACGHARRARRHREGDSITTEAVLAIEERHLPRSGDDSALGTFQESARAPTGGDASGLDQRRWRHAVRRMVATATARSIAIAAASPREGRETVGAGTGPTNVATVVGPPGPSEDAMVTPLTMTVVPAGLSTVTRRAPWHAHLGRGCRRPTCASSPAGSRPRTTSPGCSPRR